MIHLVRTNSENKDFIELVRELDADLAEKDGEDHAFYSQFNKIDVIPHVVIAYENERPVGCGAVKPFDHESMEIKRMYVVPDRRGSGIATRILKALEEWSVELTQKRCVLETGKRQPEAIQLYKRNGYQQIPNYGQYAGMENSVCFEKSLT